MSRVFVVVLVCGLGGQAFGQQGWHGVPPQGMVPVQPSQQVQVQVGPGVGPGIPAPSPAPMPVTPPTYEGWRDGWRESWVHEFRPLRNEPDYHHRGDGFYYNSSTGCYQRDVCPQQQTYCPQQQYVYPQYQYQQPVYYYRQPCSIWPW